MFHVVGVGLGRNTEYWQSYAFNLSFVTDGKSSADFAQCESRLESRSLGILSRELFVQPSSSPCHETEVSWGPLIPTPEPITLSGRGKSRHILERAADRIRPFSSRALGG